MGPLRSAQVSSGSRVSGSGCNTWTWDPRHELKANAEKISIRRFLCRAVTKLFLRFQRQRVLGGRSDAWFGEGKRTWRHCAPVGKLIAPVLA